MKEREREARNRRDSEAEERMGGVRGKEETRGGEEDVRKRHKAEEKLEERKKEKGKE